MAAMLGLTCPVRPLTLSTTKGMHHVQHMLRGLHLASPHAYAPLRGWCVCACVCGGGGAGKNNIREGVCVWVRARAWMVGWADFVLKR